MTDDGEVLPAVLDRVEQVRETTSCVRGTHLRHEIRLSDHAGHRRPFRSLTGGSEQVSARVVDQVSGSTAEQAAQPPKAVGR